MKQVILGLTVLAVCIQFNAFSQIDTIVSTNLQQKNAVVEIFTGRLCTFCPDGQEAFDDIHQSNQGRVYRVNVHAGGFAPTTYPNYRAPGNETLDNLASSAGYPSGGVNRRGNLNLDYQQNGFAMSRGEWPSAVDSILIEDAPVNIAAEAEVDVSTKTLTVDVQLFYTDSQNISENRIVIAVLQDNILGTQTGDTRYPAKIHTDGQYIHEDMVRHFFNGPFGDTITTIDSGTFIHRQYTWEYPEKVNDVPVDPGQLEIVAYVAEENENVLNATGADVDVLDQNAAIDVTAAVDIEEVDDWCREENEVVLNVTNNSGETITSFDLDYSRDFQAPNVYEFSGSISPGESEEIRFGVPLNNGNNTLRFSSIYNLNGGSNLVSNPLNISIPQQVALKLEESMSINNYNEDFESIDPTESSSLFHPWNEQNQMFVVDNSLSEAWSGNMGAYGSSAQSFVFNLNIYDEGVETGLLSNTLNIEGFEEVMLSYDFAFSAREQTENTTWEILYSFDCGLNWETAYEKSGSDLASAPVTSSGLFNPQNNDWTTDSVKIKVPEENYEDDMAVLLKITNGNGNMFFIDNIAVAGYTPVSDNLQAAQNTTYNLYPNPTSSNTTVEINTQNEMNLSIDVFDAMGQLVMNTQNQSIHSGVNQIQLNTSSLSSGMYFVSIKNEGGERTVKQLIVK